MLPAREEVAARMIQALFGSLSSSKMMKRLLAPMEVEMFIGLSMRVSSKRSRLRALADAPEENLQGLRR